MSKGSKRRPEDTKAIERNWPFRDRGPKAAPVVASTGGEKCFFCYQPLQRCQSCRRIHCVSRGGRACTALADCRQKPAKKTHDPLTASPYGFEVNREGYRADLGDPDKDTPPLINHEFAAKRGRA